MRFVAGRGTTVTIFALAISIVGVGVGNGCGVDVVSDVEGAPPSSTTTPVDDGGGGGVADSSNNLIDGNVEQTDAAPTVDAAAEDAGVHGTRVRTNLVALYEMEEGSGSILNDTSGYGMPLPLSFVSATDIAWSKGAVAVTNNNRARSLLAATKITTACATAVQLTIEAWVNIGATTLSNYARMVAIATSGDDHNAAMTTTQADLAYGLRTGGSAYSYAPVTSGLHHIVYTFAAGTKKMYVDGNLLTTAAQAGDFSGWVATHPISLFNTAALDRPMFPGAIHLVAIYARALTDGEIATNRAAGPDP